MYLDIFLLLLLFRLDIRRKFFTVTHWNRLPKEAVDAPLLEAFKAKLDVVLGSLVWWLATLHIAGGWNSMIIVDLFNPGHCMILRFYELKLMVGNVIPNLFGNKIHSWNAENNSLLCRIVLSGPWNTHISFSCTHQGSKYNEFVKIWGDFTRKNEKKTIKYVILNLAGTNCEIVLVLGWRMENLISPSSVIPRYLIIKKCMLFLSTKLGLRLYIHFSNSSKTGK